jgi:hypothetical protein
MPNPPFSVGDGPGSAGGEAGRGAGMCPTFLRRVGPIIVARRASRTCGQGRG